MNKIEEEKNKYQINSNQKNIEVYNEYGNLVFLPYSNYRENILPYNMKLNWENSDVLFCLIEDNLAYDFKTELVAAARRLLELEAASEKNTLLASVVMSKNYLFDEARSILQAYIENYGPTASILVHLADLQQDEEQAQELIWQAVQHDPNSAEALDRWINMRDEQDKQIYIQNLTHLAELPHAWRPQLYLACVYIKDRDLETARPFFQHVLNKAPIESDALMIITESLFAQGYFDEIIESIKPYYTFKCGNAPVVIQHILWAFRHLKMIGEGLLYIDFLRQYTYKMTRVRKEPLLQYYFFFEVLENYEQMLKTGN